MKRIPLIAFTLFALTASSVAADKSNKVDYPLGVFCFDFGRLAEDEAGQIRELRLLAVRGKGIGN